MLVNGKEMELSCSISLYDFLLKQGFEPEKVAVEYNGQVIPRLDFRKKIIENSAQLEIVNFVGGG